MFYMPVEFKMLSIYISSRLIIDVLFNFSSIIILFHNHCVKNYFDIENPRTFIIINDRYLFIATFINSDMFNSSIV